MMEMRGPAPSANGAGPDKVAAKRLISTPPKAKRQTLPKLDDRFTRFGEIEEGYDYAYELTCELMNAAKHYGKLTHCIDYLEACLLYSESLEDLMQPLFPGVDLHWPSRKSIRQRCAELVASFPAGWRKSPDGKAYVERMADFVAAAQPSVMVLETAARSLVRTLNSTPSINQVLKAIEKAEEIWKKRFVVDDARSDGRIRKWIDAVRQKI